MTREQIGEIFDIDFTRCNRGRDCFLGIILGEIGFLRIESQPFQNGFVFRPLDRPFRRLTGGLVYGFVAPPFVPDIEELDAEIKIDPILFTPSLGIEKQEFARALRALRGAIEQKHFPAVAHETGRARMRLHPPH